MITTLLIVISVISLGLNVSAYILIRNLLKKQEIYEQWILEFKTAVNTTLADMRQIDKQGVFATSVNEKGIFESDDQVGEVFKQITALIEKLNERTQ
jgi:hypothetical protein